MSDENSTSSDGTETTGSGEGNENSTDSTLLTGDDKAGEGNEGQGSEGSEGASGSEGEGEGSGSEGAPEEYADFSLPEGMEVDKELLDKAVPLFKQANMSQETAQAFVDLQAAAVQGHLQAQQEAFTAQIGDWEASAKSDPEIGGDAFEENLGIAKLALEKIGTPALTKFLEETGAGSHPEVLRAFTKMGKLFKEDTPGSEGTGETSKDRVQRMYPNNT